MSFRLNHDELYTRNFHHRLCINSEAQINMLTIIVVACYMRFASIYLSFHAYLKTCFVLKCIFSFSMSGAVVFKMLVFTYTKPVFLLLALKCRMLQNAVKSVNKTYLKRELRRAGAVDYEIIS